MLEIEEKTGSCVRFQPVPDPAPSEYVQFIKADGCYTEGIGRIFACESVLYGRKLLVFASVSRSQRRGPIFSRRVLDWRRRYLLPYLHKSAPVVMTFSTLRLVSNVSDHASLCIPVVNQLSLSSEPCFEHGVIIHELLHVLGFFHEHSRSDRDDWIDIRLENLQPGLEGRHSTYFSHSLYNYLYYT